MAEKRMFSKKITESDAFLDMPSSTQLLYFHLSMNADDDGFVDKPKTIMRMIGVKDDDIKLLVAKSFIIPFDSGIVVIKHWRINNYLRNDRYKKTTYTEEMALLTVKENGAYTLGIPNDNQMETQYSIDKIRLDKNSIEENGEHVADTHRFVPPTIEQVTEYCKERNNSVDCERFINFYESKGWLVGKNKMKDWKAALRTWETSKPKQAKTVNFTERTYSKDDMDKMFSDIHDVDNIDF